MASTPAFQNLIRRIVKHGETFHPVQQGFMFATSDSGNTWYPSSGTPIPCNITGSNASTSNPPFLRFHYSFSSGGNRYYLPEGDTKIERIKVYCKYGTNDPFIEIHEADISDAEVYDANDYINTITVKINVETDSLDLSREIVKNLDPAFTEQNLQPYRFVFYDSSFGTSGMPPYTSPDVTEDENGVSIATQLSGLGLNDALSLTVYLDSVDFQGESIGGSLVGPSKYRVYTASDLLLDYGDMNEGQTSQVTWEQFDSIKFTYTNTVLDQQ